MRARMTKIQEKIAFGLAESNEGFSDCIYIYELITPN